MAYKISCPCWIRYIKRVRGRRHSFLFQFSIPLSLSLFPCVRGNSQNAIIQPRNCPERHFPTPFSVPLISLVCPPLHPLPLHYSYRPTASKYPSIVDSLPLTCIMLFSHTIEYIQLRQRIATQKQRLQYTRRVERELRPRASRCRGEWRVPSRNSTKHRKQCQRI